MVGMAMGDAQSPKSSGGGSPSRRPRPGRHRIHEVPTRAIQPRQRMAFFALDFWIYASITSICDRSQVAWYPVTLASDEGRLLIVSVCEHASIRCLNVVSLFSPSLPLSIPTLLRLHCT